MKISIFQIPSVVAACEKNYTTLIQHLLELKKKPTDLYIVPHLYLTGTNLKKHNIMTLAEQSQAQLHILHTFMQHNALPAILIGSLFIDPATNQIKEGIFLLAETLQELCSRPFSLNSGSHHACYKTITLHNQKITAILASTEQLLTINTKDTQIPADSPALVYTSTPYLHNAPPIQPILAAFCKQHAVPLLYSNTIGVQTEQIFMGESGVYTATKNTQAQQNKATIIEAELENSTNTVQTHIFPLQQTPLQATAITSQDNNALLWQALVFGVKEYLTSRGFTKVVLGLSGGVDSALVASLATHALGAENVLGILMPSEFTSQQSIDLAAELAQNLGISTETIPIQPLFESFKKTLAPLFANTQEDTTEENIQARIRAVLVMAISNKFGHFLLNTSNKSEVAIGYSTLYGDMCGGLAPIGDIYKTQVFELCCWYNSAFPQQHIPDLIITRPPSAELRANQTDQDSLPPYDLLDAILYEYFDLEQTAENIAQQFDAASVTKVVKLINGATFKRRYSAPILNVSTCPLAD